MFKSIFFVVAAFGLSACTSIKVSPVGQAERQKIQEVCIVNNPAVTIGEFVPVLERRFAIHSIRTRRVAENNISNCSYFLRYSARRSWDITTYLSWAELNLFNHNRLVANAEYSLIGKGGLSLMKWQSVETKMNPVVDKLLGISVSNTGQPQISSQQPQISYSQSVDSGEEHELKPNESN